MSLSDRSAARWNAWVQPGLRAVRRHWPALVVIQVGALALLIAYYRSPWLQAQCGWLAEVRVKDGLRFAFLVGFTAGGVIPEIAKLLSGGLKRLDKAWLAESLFNGLTYGIIAIEVDLFYRLQTYLFGSENSLTTLTYKTAFDMLVFSPVITIPSATFLLAWRNAGYRVEPLFKDGFRAFYLNRVMAGLVPCWFFWTPVLYCTYAMPTNLQLVFANLAEAAWSILFVFIAKADAPLTTAP